jgi:UrcA family protein
MCAAAAADWRQTLFIARAMVAPAPMRRLKMSSICKLIAAIALTASITNVAQAQTSMAVKAGDLDLSTSRGKKQLAARIDHAATALCASEAVSQSPQMIRAERRCKTAAKQSVQQQIAARGGLRTAAD